MDLKELIFEKLNISEGIIIFKLVVIKQIVKEAAKWALLVWKSFKLDEFYSQHHNTIIFLLFNGPLTSWDHFTVMGCEPSPKAIPWSVWSVVHGGKKGPKSWTWWKKKPSRRCCRHHILHPSLSYKDFPNYRLHNQWAHLSPWKSVRWFPDLIYYSVHLFMIYSLL